ncbi:MAG: 6-pyruvoyl tetrahydropterin synthase family protein [Hyphomicrobiales bacterium]
MKSAPGSPSGTVSVTRRLEWDAMHRIANHESVCKAFHGHRYVAEITCSAPGLDELGRVIDFGVIKSELGGWIDAHFDHTAILQKDDPDPAARAVIESNQAMGKPAYLLDGPPTAENIAIELAVQAARLLRAYGITVTQIRVWETPNCSATWTPGGTGQA